APSPPTAPEVARASARVHRRGRTRRADAVIDPPAETLPRPERPETRVAQALTRLDVLVQVKDVVRVVLPLHVAETRVVVAVVGFDPSGVVGRHEVHVAGLHRER